MTDNEFLAGVFRDIEAEQDAADWGPACAHCDADIEFTVEPGDPLILQVWIAHEQGCPRCPSVDMPPPA